MGPWTDRRGAGVAGCHGSCADSTVRAQGTVVQLGSDRPPPGGPLCPVESRFRPSGRQVGGQPGAAAFGVGQPGSQPDGCGFARRVPAVCPAEPATGRSPRRTTRRWHSTRRPHGAGFPGPQPRPGPTCAQSKIPRRPAPATAVPARPSTRLPYLRADQYPLRPPFAPLLRRAAGERHVQAVLALARRRVKVFGALIRDRRFTGRHPRPLMRLDFESGLGGTVCRAGCSSRVRMRPPGVHVAAGGSGEWRTDTRVLTGGRRRLLPGSCRPYYRRAPRSPSGKILRLRRRSCQDLSVTGSEQPEAGLGDGRRQARGLSPPGGSTPVSEPRGNGRSGR